MPLVTKPKSRRKRRKAPSWVDVTLVASVDTPKSSGGRKTGGRFRATAALRISVRRDRLVRIQDDFEEIVREYFKGAPFKVGPIDDLKPSKARRFKVIQTDFEYLERSDRKYEKRTQRQIDSLLRGELGGEEE